MPTLQECQVEPQQISGRYSLVVDPSNNTLGIRHEDCGKTSWHRQDVTNRYCGACHVWLDHLTAVRRKEQAS